MSWQRSSTVGPVPDDPVGATVAESIAEMLRWFDKYVKNATGPRPPAASAPRPPTASAPATPAKK